MTPVDAAARDEIRDLHDATLFVEAGAGTGKTTALVNRVVSLIARGRVGMRELAAITFTEAAAGELLDRIRDRLQRDGVPIVEEWEEPGYVSVKCRDPDGYVVELAWEPD